MLAGIALLGVVTAALASWFVERLGQTREKQAEAQTERAQILAELRELPQELSRS